jgi:hypothetical protein
VPVGSGLPVDATTEQRIAQLEREVDQAFTVATAAKGKAHEV